jgi:hypothetical protein
MNKIAKIFLLAVGAATMTQALQAQLATQPANPANNDLILGFTSQASGVTEDYVLDLGQIPTSYDQQMGGVSMSTFNSIFGSALANGQVNVGVVAGSSSFMTGDPNDVITSVLDNGWGGTPTLPGSSAPPAPNSPSIQNAAALVLDLTPGFGGISSSSESSFTYNIAQSPTTYGTGIPSFSSSLFTSPLTTINSSEEVLLDLYEDTATGRTTTGYSYVGSIEVNLSGSTLSVTYDSVVPVMPEPGIYGLLAGVALLAMALSRQGGPDRSRASR